MQGCKYPFSVSLIRLCWMSLLLLGFANAVQAAEEITTQLLEKNQLVPGARFMVRDDKFAQVGGTAFKDFSKKNLIRFAIDANATTYYQEKPFTAELIVKISIYNTNPSDTNSIKETYQDTLRIQYDTTKGKAYQGEDFLKFKDAYKYLVEVISITNSLNRVLPIFQLKGTTYIQRKYTFSETPVGKLKWQTTGTKTTLSWGGLANDFPGAELFDLEYLLLDEYDERAQGIKNALSQGNNNGVSANYFAMLFSEGATRVTLSENSYTLNQVYEKGLVIFRVRGVQFPNELDDSITHPFEKFLRYETAWVYEGEQSNQVGNVFVSVGHQPNLNWQYTASFAEEGKRKEVMGYFDGTGRKRQLVTQDNSNNVSVVQEDMYDEMGRASLSVLPAPVQDNIIKYFSGFNLNTSGKPYSEKDFLSAANCRVTPLPMSTQSGAGRYYSPNNPFTDKAHNAYIPNAEGFPFAVTEFTPDQTGRILTQGGVGSDFQPMNGHETKYYYGKPTQESLDRLFGPEAGNASHYLKNMVQDANGQLSVSYVNSSGKTVATALAGKTPFNVQSLETNVLPQSTLQQLLTPNDFTYQPADRSLRATATFLLSVASQPEIRINLQPAMFTVASSQGSLCHTCVYRLSVVVRDFCNNVVGSGNYPIGTINNACSNPTIFNQAITLQNGSENLSPGEYTANFELVSDEQAVDLYDASHFANNKDIKTPNFFLLEQLKQTDFSSCYNTCKSCEELTKMGQQGWITQISTLYQQENLVFGAADEAYATQLYITLTDNCRALTGCSEPAATSTCDDLLSQMIPDVTPGGQYALYDATNFSLLEPEVNVIALRTDPRCNWSTVPQVLSDNGQLVSPGALSEQEFIQKFQPEWAKVMVVLHPEYCYYTFCTQNSISEQFDSRLQQETDASKAKEYGWFGNSTQPVTNDWLLNIDPFFNTQNGVKGLGADMKAQMAGLLNNYSATEPETRNIRPAKGILDFIQYVLYCKDPVNGYTTDSWAAPCAIANNCRSPYMEWMQFRNNYLALKARFVEKVRVAGGCNACYIGGNDLPTSTQDSIPVGGGIIPKASDYEILSTEIIRDPNCDHNVGDKCTDDIRVVVSRIDGQKLNCDVTINFYVHFLDASGFRIIESTRGSVMINANDITGFTNFYINQFVTIDSIEIRNILSTTCTNSSSSTIQLPSPSGNCTPDVNYQNKIRRVIPYLNGDGISFSSTSNVAQPDNQQVLAEMVQNRADAILGELATNATCTISTAALGNMRSSLVTLLSNTLTKENPYGSSTFDNSTPSFEQSFMQNVGSISGVDCSPYLVSMFYPLNAQPILEAKQIIQSDISICTRLNTLLSESGLTATNYAGFHQYLQNRFPQQYQLSQLELTDLVESCNSCNATRYLEKPLRLPIFLESGAVSISRARFLELVDQFHTAHNINSGNLPTESAKDNYALAYTNYLNYKTGFSLTYSDYMAFANNPAATELANQYTTPAAENLLSSCTAQLFLTASGSARNTYNRYADSIHLAFRNGYLAACSQVNPGVQLATLLHEYHYTLYYYDQSGNLVKTVPPKGVTYSTAAGTYPQHTLVTTYEYNSFNQVTRQTTPDAGTSAFWYDVLGRLVASQNAEQKNPLNGGSVGRYSYTFYDALGRIIEVGETVNQTGFTLPEMTDAISKDPVQLAEWKSKGIKTQITQTFYDAPAVGIVPHVDITAMQGLGSNRKRVVSTITRNSSADLSYQTGTHYVYDITGNVRTLWQEVESLRELQKLTRENDSNGIKRIDYNYDLVSGKVNQVTYQKDKGDQFLYRYQYDAENRLTQATTSTDGLAWKTQAAYQYYLHGPLSRVELGEQVQATDYAYTLQGWMKYINGPILDPEADMGNDGTNKNPTNFYFGRDVMAFGINYYAGDYTPIQNTPGNRFTNNFQLNSLPTGQPLYNGNISATLLALKGLNNNTTTGYTYLYDQLNRLLNTRQHTFGAASGSFMGNWTQSNTNTTDNYAETFRYDANGNILQLNRNGNSQHPGGQAMDRLNYTYRDGTNQLWSVQDGIAAGAYAGDIDNQGGSNYSYDRIGNLIGDVSENISQVNWTVYGKIGNIQKKQAFLGYVYNAGGERVVKQYLPYATNQCAECPPGTGIDDLEVYERNSATPETYKARKTITFLSEYTDVRYRDYSAIIDAGLAQCTPQCNVQPPLNTSDADIYIRDATGNTLAVYHYDRKTAQLRWSEQHLYGSSRLGMYQPEKIVTSVSTDSKQREVGYLGKQIFELSNHLGNVLATITDKKLQVSTNTTITDYFEADVQTVQDYYAFGMQMPGRKYLASNSAFYRYSINGQEKDLELNENITTAEYWEYDSRIGRRWNVDPVPDESQSPYAVFDNNPIAVTDPDGDCTTCPSDPIESKYLGWTGLGFGSFGNGVADGFIGALPELGEFVWDLISSKEARNNFSTGLGAIFDDPLGSIKAIAADKYELWSSVLSGNGTEQQKYEVGKELGNTIFGALSGAALSKLTEIIKVAKYEKQLIKIAEQADEATGAGKATVRGTKIHTKFEKGVNNTSKAKRAEVSYKDGKVRKRGTEGTSRADAIYGKNQAKPQIAYDLKTGKSPINKADAAKYKKNLPPGTKLKEISKDQNGNYKIKKVKY